MQVLSHLNPNSNIFVSLPSTIWPPFRSSLSSHVTPILVPILMSHSFQVSFPLHPSLKICGSLPSRYHLTHIQAWRCKAHINLCPISFSSSPLRFMSHFHPGRTSPQCRSWYLCLTSIHVTSQLHSVPPKLHLRHHLKPIQHHSICVSHHFGPVSTVSRSQAYCINSSHVRSDLQGPYINISPPSK